MIFLKMFGLVNLWNSFCLVWLMYGLMYFRLRSDWLGFGLVIVNICPDVSLNWWILNCFNIWFGWLFGLVQVWYRLPAQLHHALWSPTPLRQLQVSHRRRRKTKENATVVAAVWGAEFIHFLAGWIDPFILNHPGANRSDDLCLFFFLYPSSMRSAFENVHLLQTINSICSGSCVGQR